MWRSTGAADPQRRGSTAETRLMQETSWWLSRGTVVRGLGTAEEGRHSETRQPAGSNMSSAWLVSSTGRRVQESVAELHVEATQCMNGRSDDDSVMSAWAISLVQKCPGQGS